MNSRFPPMVGTVMEPVALPTEPLNQQQQHQQQQPLSSRSGQSGPAFSVPTVPPSSSSLFAFGPAGTAPGSFPYGSPGLTGSSSGSGGSPEATNRLGFMPGQVPGTVQPRTAGGSPPFSGGSSLLVSTSSWRESRERLPSPGSRPSSLERARFPDHVAGRGQLLQPSSLGSATGRALGVSYSSPLLASPIPGASDSFTAPAGSPAAVGGSLARAEGGWGGEDHGAAAVAAAGAGAGVGAGGADAAVGSGGMIGMGGGGGASLGTEAGGEGSAAGYKSEARLRSPASPVLAGRLLRSDVTEALNNELEAIRGLRIKLASIVDDAEESATRLPGSTNADAAGESRVSNQDSDSICPPAYFEQVLNAIREVLAVLREDHKAQVDLTPVLLSIKHSTNEVVDAFNARNPSDVDFSQLLKAVQASRRQVILPPNFAKCGATKATYGFGPSVWSCCGRKVDESTGSHDCLTCPGRTGLPPQSEDEGSPTAASTSRLKGSSDDGFTVRIVACGQNDCPEMVNAEDLDDHRRHHCAHRKVQCSNEGCCAYFSPSERAAHEAACGHSVQTCQCGLEVKMKDLASHLRDCSLRRVSCPYEGCDKVLSASELSSHLDSCPHRKVNCKNPGCPTLCKQLQLPSHEQTCEFRKGSGRGPTFAKFPQLNFQSVRDGAGRAQDSPSEGSGSPSLQVQSDGGLQSSPRSPSPSPGTPQWGSPQSSPMGKPHKGGPAMMGIPEGGTNSPREFMGGNAATPPAPPPRPVEKKTPSYLTLDKIRSKLKAASYTNGGADWGKLFREQDKDHSGSLDWPEFLSMCRRALRMPEPEPQLKHIFDNLDVEKAGAINIEDLLGFIDDPIRRMRARMRAAMQEQGLFHLRDTLTEFDEDGNGLDWQEFRGLCRHKLKMFDADDQLRLVFSGLDADQSGRISPGELQSFLFADKEGKDENTFRANRVPGALPHSMHAAQPRVPSHAAAAAPPGPGGASAGAHSLSVPGSGPGHGDSLGAASESSGSPQQVSSPPQGATSPAASPAASPPPSPKESPPPPPAATAAIAATAATPVATAAATPPTPASASTSAPTPTPTPAASAAPAPAPSAAATTSPATATAQSTAPASVPPAATISLPAPKAVPSPNSTPVPSPPPSPKAVPKISVKAAPALPKQVGTARRGSQMTELFSDSEDPSPASASGAAGASPASSDNYETASASVALVTKAAGKAPAGSPPAAKARLSQSSIGSSAASSTAAAKRLAAPKAVSPKRSSVAATAKGAAAPGKARGMALQVPGASPKRGTAVSPSRR